MSPTCCGPRGLSCDEETDQFAGTLSIHQQAEGVDLNQPVMSMPVYALLTVST
jgi:hypothetical protein